MRIGGGGGGGDMRIGGWMNKLHFKINYKPNNDKSYLK